MDNERFDDPIYERVEDTVQVPTAAEHLRISLYFGLPFIIVAVLCAWLLPAGHGVSVVPAAVAACLLTASMTFELEFRSGWIACSQAAFVLLLFALPLNLVPLAACACAAASDALKRKPWHALLLCAVNSWYAIAPVTVLALAARGRVGVREWPIYVLAFGLQILVGEVIAALRDRVLGQSTELSAVSTAVTVDALLTPVGLLAALAMRRAPQLGVAALLGVTGLLVLLGRERRERQIQAARALRDPLTGLANRALFSEAMRASVARCERGGVSAGLLLLDLDNFKQINDAHGHRCGDEVLRVFARRLRGAIRGIDTAARIGGDEFAVILAEPMTNDGARAVAEKLCAAINGPVSITDQADMELTASVGVAVFDAAQALSGVVERADRSLYEFKRAVRSRLCTTPTLSGQASLAPGR